MLVSCLGDIMLDVIVDVPGGLVPDDDSPAHITFAAGGQAANVAAWVTAFGGVARLFGPRAQTGPGHLVDEALSAAGIDVHGPLTGRAGAVMSLVADGYRSLASDPGAPEWLDAVRPGAWLADADWLFVSGYALLRAAHPEHVLEVAEVARAAGTKVAVDLSSAAMIEDFGPPRFRELWQGLQPAVVLANEQEWEATSWGVSEHVGAFGASGTSVLAIKQGSRGCTFVIDGITDHRPPVYGPVRDVTGAGDALAAGFLVGGVDLAMEAAARCVSQVGAQPHTVLPEIP